MAPPTLHLRQPGPCLGLGGLSPAMTKSGSSLPSWVAQSPPNKVCSMVALVNGEQVGQVSLDHKPSFIIGRNPAVCSVPLPHMSISRRHCMIAHHRDGTSYIMDLGSAHGTFVWDRRIPPMHPVLLKAGCLLRFGAAPQLFLFKEWCDVVPAAPPDSPLPVNIRINITPTVTNSATTSSAGTATDTECVNHGPDALGCLSPRLANTGISATPPQIIDSPLNEPPLLSVDSGRAEEPLPSLAACSSPHVQPLCMEVDGGLGSQVTASSDMCDTDVTTQLLLRRNTALNHGPGYQLSPGTLRKRKHAECVAPSHVPRRSVSHQRRVSFASTPCVIPSHTDTEEFAEAAMPAAAAPREAVGIPLGDVEMGGCASENATTHEEPRARLRSPPLSPRGSQKLSQAGAFGQRILHSPGGVDTKSWTSSPVGSPRQPPPMTPRLTAASSSGAASTDSNQSTASTALDQMDDL